MSGRSFKNIKSRMKEIEDRKIEILIEIGNINNNINEKVWQLNSEYRKLHKEYYLLQIELLNKK
jgi:hypothetical protein